MDYRSRVCLALLLCTSLSRSLIPPSERQVMHAAALHHAAAPIQTRSLFPVPLSSPNS
jgi:hypothetical protein